MCETCDLKEAEELLKRALLCLENEGAPSLCTDIEEFLDRYKEDDDAK